MTLWLQTLDTNASRLHEQAEELGRSADADRAFETSRRALRQAAASGDHDLIPIALTRMLRYSWAAARCAEALPVVERYVRRHRSGWESRYDLSLFLNYAHILAIIGDVDAACDALRKADGFEHPISLDDIALLLHEHAYIAMLVGDENKSTVLYERAAEIARTRVEPHVRVQVLSNFASHMCALGRMKESIELHDEAIRFARREKISWRLQYCVVSCAMSLYRGGRCAEAHDMLKEAEADRPLSPQVEMSRAMVGLFLSAAMGNADLYDRYGAKAHLERAFASRETQRIANIVSALHRAYVFAKRTDQARSLLDRARPVVPYARSCNMLHVDIAKNGSPECLTDAIRGNAQIAGRSNVARAFSHLLEAGIRQRRGEPTALHQADRAALAFEGLNWPLHRAAALELGGRFREAGALYASCQAYEDARRVRSVRLPRGRPRRMSGRLTTREWEVAKLCVTGLRNHEIAERLGVSVGTVRFHVCNILRELNLTSRHELREALTDFRLV
jgi:ATP/maltotriose-dependent transcriptional regulator MalT